MKMHCREDGACTKTTSSVGECDHRAQSAEKQQSVRGEEVKRKEIFANLGTYK